MSFSPPLAQIRFGTGLRAGVDGPNNVDQIMRIARDDSIAATFPIFVLGGDHLDLLTRQRDLTRQRRQDKRAGNETPQAQRTIEQLRSLNRDVHSRRMENLRNTVARGVHTDHGLRDRLTWFWADHFTAQGKTYLHKGLYGDYLETAIRRHSLGRFEDLLWAAISHPLMLHYLDQSASAGPNSRVGQRRPERGLNENLAREILELHTLSVNGPYTQADVTGLALALTGLSEQLVEGMKWHARKAEPGPFSVLGQSFAAPARMLGDVRPLIQALARHPATAAHIAYKLARHFVSDTPPAGLVDHLTDVFVSTDGDLDQVTEALLRHPASWSPELHNVKWPIEVIASGLRALNLPPQVMQRMRPHRVRSLIQDPLTKMGQRWQGAPGPDGVAEADNRWITPQGLASRLEWALSAPDQLLVRFPDPRQVLDDALGAMAPASLRFAVESATLRHEGIAMILTSPAFQRR